MRRGRHSGLSVVALLALAGCQPTDAPPAPAPPPPEAEPFIHVPDPFERDMAKSEDAAIKGVQKGPAKALCAALVNADAAGVEAQLGADFEGRWVAPVAKTAATGDDSVVVQRYPVDGPTEQGTWAQPPLDAKAFAKALVRHHAAIQVIDRCALKPFNFKLSADGRWAWARLHFEVAALGEVRRADWDAELRTDGTAWRFHRIRSGEVTRTTHRAWSELGTDEPLSFHDISEQAGVGFRFAEVAEENRQDLIDFGARDGIGGLAVLDWDGDGFDDIVAWQRRRALTLFRNDGRGGFVARNDLVEPAQVGYFQLLVDLDGDGALELVSTETVCTGGTLRFPVWTRRDDALDPVPGGLSLQRPCTETHGADLREADPVIFQHIAAHDIDRDGDLDLYLSGYAGRHSRRANFNLYDATDGERDLLFLNDGGLKFSEQGVERGIKGTRWTYVASFFDFDEDGDDDLYVANDYGPNSLYLNDGDGFFALQPPSMWTPNSQSMGITVADFDGDLDFDVYVSNMYSKAGNRLVPLVEGTVPKGVYETLLGSAAGNWMFERRGKGEYGEVAQPWGVADAGWAWGQVAFDFDNDADRDLYVVNGMTSHSRYKDDDF